VHHAFLSTTDELKKLKNIKFYFDACSCSYLSALVDEDMVFSEAEEQLFFAGRQIYRMVGARNNRSVVRRQEAFPHRIRARCCLEGSRYGWGTARICGSRQGDDMSEACLWKTQDAAVGVRFIPSSGPSSLRLRVFFLMIPSCDRFIICMLVVEIWENDASKWLCIMGKA